MKQTFDLGTDWDTKFEVTPTGDLILTFSNVYLEDDDDRIIPRSFSKKDALQLRDFLLTLTNQPKETKCRTPNLSPLDNLL